MYGNHIVTVGDLIAALATQDPAAPVRLVTDSGAEFMDFAVGRVVCTPADSDSDCVLPNDAPVVRIGTGDTYCCLPDFATDALGWPR
jgi:hypothetical protein